MKTKKTIKANLERKRIIFFEYGVLVSLSLSLIAFEWGSDIETGNYIYDQGGFPFDEDQSQIIPYRPQLPSPPPVIVPHFEIVEPEIEFEEDPFQFNADADPGESYNLYLFPEEEEEIEHIPICPIPDTDAGFDDGDIKSFQAYVYKNLEYSDKAIDLGLEGRVLVRFIIDEKGNLINPEIIRGVDPLLDNEVLRVIKNSPEWRPARFNNRAVKVSFVIPVIFKIQ